MGEWRAFERIEGPLLIQQRLDIAAARIALIVAKAGGMKKRGGRELEISDFLIAWDEVEAEAQSAADIEAILSKEAAISQLSKPSS